jgi:pimeloyl-ACP methyl ester carboxylesterase
MKPTIVLVHGAFADASSWNGVIPALHDEGHRVIAWPNPLRSVATDAAALTDLITAIDGPVLLAGHSYGGAVMTNVPAGAGHLVGLVFIAGFALEAGESAADASALAPGSTLAETLEPVPLAAGGADVYIAQEKYHRQFAADLPVPVAEVMAVTQRPITEAALNEASGDQPAWRTLPSWFLWGELDRNIPAGAHRAMADRAGARRAVEIAGASHVVGISAPAPTAEIILEAAAAPMVEVAAGARTTG